MEQVIPQSKVGNKSAAYRRMGWFMAVILVLVLCAAGSLAWFNINMAETSSSRMWNAVCSLRPRIRPVRFRFGSIPCRISQPSDQRGSFRLFASEVNGLGNDLSTLLNASGDSSSGIDDLSQLALSFRS